MADDRRHPNFDAMIIALDGSLGSATQLQNHHHELEELKLLRNIPAVDIGLQLRQIQETQLATTRQLTAMQQTQRAMQQTQRAMQQTQQQTQRAMQQTQRAMQQTQRAMQQTQRAYTQQLTGFMSEMQAREKNNFARLENSKVFDPEGALEPMFCVNPDFAGLELNVLIPNFPTTPEELARKDGQSCRDILQALGQREPPRRTAIRKLQMLVGKCIGVPTVY